MFCFTCISSFFTQILCRSCTLLFVSLSNRIYLISVFFVCASCERDRPKKLGFVHVWKLREKKINCIGVFEKCRRNETWIIDEWTLFVEALCQIISNGKRVFHQQRSTCDLATNCKLKSRLSRMERSDMIYKMRRAFVYSMSVRAQWLW